MTYSVCLRVLLIGLAVLALVGTVQAQEPQVVRVVAHDSFAVSDDVLEAFEAETGYQVEILRVGDAGLMVNQSILSRDNPLGDVLFGVDNTFLTRALDNDLFVPYESPLRETIAPAFLDDVDERVTPIDYGDVCLNYDVKYFETHDLALPQTLEDLADPAYSGLLVVENPAASSPGLVFLLASLPSCLPWLAFGAVLQRRLQSPRAFRVFSVTMGLLLAASVIPILR